MTCKSCQIPKKFNGQKDTVGGTAIKVATGSKVESFVKESRKKHKGNK